MPTITWSNGQQDTADTWEELEARVRDTQWRHYTERGFRTAMGKRALRWSGYEINEDAPADEFFHELTLAKMVTIDDEPKPEEER